MTIRRARKSRLQGSETDSWAFRVLWEDRACEARIGGKPMVQVALDSQGIARIIALRTLGANR